MKILIIDLDNMGDVVMASFMPRALKDLYPDSYISVLVKEYSQDILKNNPFVNELIIFNPPWLEDMLDKRFSWNQTRSLVKKLKTAAYDLAIVIDSDWRKALLAKMTGIPKRVGADKKKASLFLTLPVAYAEDQETHTVQYNLNLLRVLGYQKNEVNVEVFIDNDTQQWVEGVLNKYKLGKGVSLVGIHPGAGHPARIWPATNYLQLINALQADPKIKILLLGSEHDHVIKEIGNKIDPNQVIFMQGISVLQMAALFKKCQCVIAQDSGPMHLATAVGTRTIAIFGPSNPKKFGPYGPGHIVIRKEMACSPCGSDPECDRLDCLKHISVNDVLERIKEVL